MRLLGDHRRDHSNRAIREHSESHATPLCSPINLTIRISRLPS